MSTYSRICEQFFASALVLVTFACPAFAQEPEGESEIRILEEIVVTATKRETLLRDTAMSVGVLDGEEVSGLGVHDYWRQVPSLVVTDQAFGGDRITIRGLGEEPNGISESMSAVYLDDTPVNQTDGLFTMSPDFRLVDIDRVEVLRGPQGTLFGASAMGGAVRVISSPPDPETAYGWLEGAISSTAHGSGNVDGSLMYNQPIGKGSAVRLVAYHEDRDGYIDDIGSGEGNINGLRTSGVRLAISTNVGERTALGARLAFQDREHGSFNFMDPNGKPELGLGTFDDYQVALLSDEYRDDRAMLASVSIEHETGWGDLTLISSRLDYEMGVQIDLAEVALLNFGDYAPFASLTKYDQEAWIHEIRVASNEENEIAWLAGLFFLDQDTPRTDQFYLAGEPVQLLRAHDSRRDTGVFGEVSWPVGASWTATLGARWYDVEKRGASVLNGIFTGFQDVTSELSHDESGVTPRASLSWEATESTMTYALVSKGYRAGGGNTPLAVIRCDAPESFDSDDLWNYEVGIKTEWMDGRASLNVTAYLIDWTEAQMEVEVPGCNNIFVVNAGEASSKGVEFELAMRVGSSWQIRLAAGYNRSQVDEAPPGSDIPSGADVPLVPDLTAAVSVGREFSAFNGSAGMFNLDWQYTGETRTSLFPAFNIRQDAYHLVNLRLGVDFGRWAATLFADNIFDERASLACCGINGGFTINRPRTVGVKTRFSF